MWTAIEDLGGLSELVRIPWVPGHAAGEGADARGNDWADTLAKWGAAVHGLLEETIKEAKKTRPPSARKDIEVQIVMKAGK